MTPADGPSITATPLRPIVALPPGLLARVREMCEAERIAWVRVSALETRPTFEQFWSEYQHVLAERTAWVTA